MSAGPVPSSSARVVEGPSFFFVYGTVLFYTCQATFSDGLSIASVADSSSAFAVFYSYALSALRGLLSFLSDVTTSTSVFFTDSSGSVSRRYDSLYSG